VIRSLRAIILTATCVIGLAVPMPAAAAPELTVSSADKRMAVAALKAIDRGQSKRALERTSQVSDDDLRLVLQWMSYQFASKAAKRGDMIAFYETYSTLPSRNRLRNLIEPKIDVSMPLADRLAWFEANPPGTTVGKVRHLDALVVRDGIKAHQQAIRLLWVDGKFDKSTEQSYLARYRGEIRASDHAARLQRVLWQGPRSAAQRAMYRAKGDARLLAEARYLLRYNRGNVDRAVSKVPKSLRNDPGLVFDRMRWRRKKGREAAALDLLQLKANESFLYAEERWKEHAILARWALREGRVTDAYRLSAWHGLTPGGSAYAEAEWYAGWVALRFLEDAPQAFIHFKNLADAVSTPVSLARAAYWAGRAAETKGDGETARVEFTAAANHPTVYYGQLAHEHLGRKGGLRLPEIPRIDDAAVAAFRDQPLIRGIEKLSSIGTGEKRLRRLFVGLVEDNTSAENVTLLAALARSIDRTDLAVATAKRALRDGIVLPLAGWPMLDPPDYPSLTGAPPLEPPLVLSVVRQESLFRAAAISSAGARGLMQLMPATAKRVAKQTKTKYIRSKLTVDKAYNLKLGQAYLESLIDDFNGSYILALAGYNAGPSRSRAWIKAYGDPRDPAIDSIDWVEQIPFRETRNYVQRVMENLQVYRALWSGTEVASALSQDLQRSRTE